VVLVTGIATAIVTVGAAPSQASGTVVLTGEVSFNGFGVGDTSATARLCVSGAVTASGGFWVPASTGVCSSVTGSGNANATATFEVTDPSNVCPALGDAEGIVSGAVSTRLGWTRVGAVLLFRVSDGDLGIGSGMGALAITSPVGNACNTTTSSRVNATIVGVVTGI
jgi:hypothetical protein